jgi:transcriptional regulator with XRE-family HTH domain
MQNALSFGHFLQNKRLKKGETLQITADKIGIGIMYLSEMENGKKTNPSSKVLAKMIEVLCESNEDIATFFDLHAKANGIVSQDLPEYIMSNDIVRSTLRIARDKPATDADWQEMINRLE